MRKILLASTALVAMSVSAAHADLSISGAYQFEYAQTDGGVNTTGSDGNITFKSTSTADNGITYSVVGNYGIQGMGTPEDLYMQMDGDFGTIYMGMGDEVYDRMDGVLGMNFDVEGNGQAALSRTMIPSWNNSNESINYISPSMSGVTVYGSVNDEDGKSGFGANYKNDMVEIMYQAEGGGGTDTQVVGAAFTIAGVKIGAGSKEDKTGSAKATTSDLGLSYTFDGITLAATSATHKPNSGANTTYKSIGAKYTVAPGVTALIENSDSNDAGTKSSRTFVSMVVSF